MAALNSMTSPRRRRAACAAVAIAAATIGLAACVGGDREGGKAALAGTINNSAPAGPPVPPGAVSGFKLGKPYQVAGVWYRPGFNWTYEEVGTASWYGPQFHGLTTANGERFDMNKLSAAHRTLPLPSIVQVTNLENGRSIKVRVNDRGPFANDRILDLSRHGAQLLGFQQQGTARVRVTLVADESMRLAGLDPGNAGTVSPPAGGPTRTAPAGLAAIAPGAAPMTLAAARQPPAADPATTRTSETRVPLPADRAAYRVYTAKSFIQAGAFADRENASRAGAELARLAPVMIIYNGFDGRDLFRVRLGPLDSAETDRVLAETIRAGYPGSHVIME